VEVKEQEVIQEHNLQILLQWQWAHIGAQPADPLAVAMGAYQSTPGGQGQQGAQPAATVNTQAQTTPVGGQSPQPSSARPSAAAQTQNLGPRPATRAQRMTYPTSTGQTIQNTLSSMNPQNLEEEIRMNDVNQKLKGKYNELDAMVTKATQQQMVKPGDLLNSLLSAVGSIRDQYIELYEKYKKYEEGDITLSDYSSFLDQYMINFTKQDAKLSAMPFVFEEAKTYQRANKAANEALCADFNAKVMEIKDMFDKDRINVDVYIYKWAAEIQKRLSTSRDQSAARTKVQTLYSNLVPDVQDLNQDHPHWLKRSLERRTHEVYLGSTHTAFTNERVLDLMKEAADQLGIEGLPKHIQELEKDSKTLDLVIDSYERESKIIAQGESVMRWIQQMQMDQARKDQMTQELTAASQDAAVLGERARKAEDEVLRLDDRVKRLEKSGLVKLIGGIIGGIATAAGLILTLYLPLRTEEIRGEKDAAILAKQKADADKTKAEEKATLLREERDEKSAELVKYGELGTLEELAKREDDFNVLRGEKAAAERRVTELTGEIEGYKTKLEKYAGIDAEKAKETKKIMDKLKEEKKAALAEVDGLKGRIDAAVAAQQKAEEARDAAILAKQKADADKAEGEKTLGVYTKVGTPKQVKALLEGKTDLAAVLADANFRAKKYQEMKEGYDALTAEKETAEKNAAKYKKERDEKGAELAKYEGLDLEKLKNSQEVIDGLEAEKKAALAEVDGLKQKLDEAKSANPAKVTELTDKLNAANEKVGQLTATLDAYDEAIKDKIKADGTVDPNVVSAGAGVIALKLRGYMSEGSVDDFIKAKARVKELEEELANIPSAGADPAKVTELERKLAQSKKELVDMQKKLEEANRNKGRVKVGTGQPAAAKITKPKEQKPIDMDKVDPKLLDEILDIIE